MDTKYISQHCYGNRGDTAELRMLMPFSGPVFLSQRAAIKPCWVWVAGATLLLGLAGRRHRGTPKKVPSLPLASPARSLRAGHISSIDCCFLCESPEPPLYVTYKKKSSWKVKIQPIIPMCFLRVACFVDVCDRQADGLTFELFIHTSQPAQVGPH